MLSGASGSRAGSGDSGSSDRCNRPFRQEFIAQGANVPTGAKSATEKVRQDRTPLLCRSVAMRFFLIDRITKWEVGSLAEGIKNVALSEDFFDDHFPRRPVMPGVLILEGMAQLAGLLLEASLKQQYDKNAKAVLTVLERTKFRAMVKPGDSLLLRAEMISLNEAGGKIKAVAQRGEQLVTSTEMVFAFKYIEDPLLDEKRGRLMDLWRQ